MKTSERHRIKEDDFQIALARTRDQMAAQRKPIAMIVGAVVVVGGLITGYVLWTRSTNDKAAAMFAEGIVTSATPVMPPNQTPTEENLPGQIAKPQGKSFPSEKARADAAIAKFVEAAQAYPTTRAGIAANYRAAALLAEQGKASDAEARFNDVITRDGNGVYGRMAKLGLAMLQIQTKQYDQAIAALMALSQRTDTDMPVDAVLMQLGDAYQRAGRTPDAVRTFSRIVDEFPQSPYLTDARRRLDDLKAAPAARS